VISKAVALESLGFQDFAHRELSLAARFDGRPEARAAYAAALRDRGHMLEAQRLGEQTLSGLSRAPLSLWRLAYPQPYEEHVLSAADEFDVDPLLLWAIMYQESRYDPEALSWARAQGLMQLMPTTAEWAAEEADPSFSPLDVYDPEANIRLGAWYVRWLLDYFDGDLELAVVAYNGGPGNAAAWDERAERREDFFRWIGYGESREYLTRVLTAYHIYRTLDRLS
jgi:soluble lytic murein transglycosylase